MELLEIDLARVRDYTGVQFPADTEAPARKAA